MRYKTEYKALARLIDHDGSEVRSKPLNESAAGFACIDDSVLNYAELSFAEECDLRRGYPRIVLDEKGRLQVSVEIDSKRQLSTVELRALKTDFAGQLTDGIGSGCFDAISADTGISVEIRMPLKATCTQQEGQAWKPVKSAAKGNDRRIAAIKKLVDRKDKKNISIAAGSSKAGKEGSDVPKAKSPNFSKLLRLLSKVDREFIFDQIEAELVAIGGDLSQLPAGTFPSGNFRDPKFLRLLLKAGLSPEAQDSKGHALVFQAAGSPACLEILLKRNANVNTVGTDLFIKTPLMRAAFLGNLKCIQMLLNAGADASVKNFKGNTAIDVINSHSRDRKAIETLLKESTSGRQDR